MKFELDRSIEILERTPGALHALLDGLSTEWSHQNEGPDTWSPYDVVGHLLQGDQVSWVTRIRSILAEKGHQSTFPPIDRNVQFEASSGRSLARLLDEFEQLRFENMAMLKSFSIDESDLELRSDHPAFGTVTLSQFLSAWVVHDLGHIAQIVRVMAKQYKTETGPWQEYLPILNWK